MLSDFVWKPPRFFFCLSLHPFPPASHLPPPTYLSLHRPVTKQQSALAAQTKAHTHSSQTRATEVNCIRKLKTSLLNVFFRHLIRSGPIAWHSQSGQSFQTTGNLLVSVRKVLSEGLLTTFSRWLIFDGKNI